MFNTEVIISINRFKNVPFVNLLEEKKKNVCKGMKKTRVRKYKICFIASFSVSRSREALTIEICRFLTIHLYIPKSR